MLTEGERQPGLDGLDVSAVARSLDSNSEPAVQVRLSEPDTSNSPTTGQAISPSSVYPEDQDTIPDDVTSPNNQEPTEAGAAPALGSGAGSEPSVEIFKRVPVSMDDTTRVVLPAALKKAYNIFADWRNYNLNIEYEGAEYSCGWDEKPLISFRTLDRAGKKPMFRIRRRSIPYTLGNSGRTTEYQLPGGVL